MLMDAYLLTWKLTEWEYEQLSHYLKRFEEGNETLRWSAGTSKKIPLGSRVFLTKQGLGARGIFGSGFTASEAFEAPHYNEELRKQGKIAIYVDVTFGSLYDCCR
jgi:5-methylcytosine-specific restriction protein A